MEEFFDTIEDISDNLDKVMLAVDDAWMGGEDFPPEYAEDFEKAVSHLGRAHELISKILKDILEKWHDEY